MGISKNSVRFLEIVYYFIIYRAIALPASYRGCTDCRQTQYPSPFPNCIPPSPPRKKSVCSPPHRVALLKSTTPTQASGHSTQRFALCVLIRWLQSALIPFVTTQSVRQNYTSVYSFDCKLWLCHNIATIRNHRRPWR